MKYFDAKYEHFRLSGFYWFEQDDVFCRIPLNRIKHVNDIIKQTAWHTTGGILRFKTDSLKIAIKAELSRSEFQPIMAVSGSSGFDIYSGSGPNKVFYRNISPAINTPNFEICVPVTELQEYKGDKMKEWTIYFPLYNGVNKLHIGLEEGATILPAPDYLLNKPVVFYGSSITQGAYASRPGNTYPACVCRWLDANFINLGFGGGAKGEIEMAEIISSIDMSALVMDYDHNAPDVEYLAATHELFFKHIRQAKPELPVIFLSRPDFDLNPGPGENMLRREIIYTTYRNAVNSGDKNVYFIDGETLFGTDNRDMCTVDTTHPNDLGFLRMAKVIYPVLSKALSLLKY